jgi:integrase/recombinase XerD
MDLSEAVRLFLRSCSLEKNLSVHTLRAYGTDLRQFTEFATTRGVTTPPLVSCDFVQEHIENLKVAKRHRDSSIRRKIAVMRTFIKFLERRGLIEQNPLARITFSFRQERRLPTILSRHEINSILTRARDLSTNRGVSNCTLIRNYAFLELLFYSGARVGEILKLDLPDCDLKSGVAKIKGKGRRERIIYIGCDPVITALRSYLHLRRSVGPNECALFLNRNGRRLSVYSAERIVKKYAESVGVHSRVTPHVFRHTMATMMLENGADLRSIQEILGHASISTTEIYTHVSAERQRQVMAEFHPRRFFLRSMNVG